MARQRHNAPSDDGRRSPAAEEQKANDNEVQLEGANGVDAVSAQVNSGGAHGGRNGGGRMAGRLRGRDGNDLGETGRNVRQNVGAPHPDHNPSISIGTTQT